MTSRWHLWTLSTDLYRLSIFGIHFCNEKLQDKYFKENCRGRQPYLAFLEQYNYVTQKLYYLFDNDNTTFIRPPEVGDVVQ